MKRIKLIIVMAVAMAVMAGAAVSPALAVEDWGWTDWQQWEDTPWYCSWLWYVGYEEGSGIQQAFCYNINTGEIWSWPS